MLDEKTETNVKRITTLRIKQGEYLDKAKYDDGTDMISIPSNSIIDKQFTGLGGTTLELKDKSRNSIIVIPDKSPSWAKLSEMNSKPAEYTKGMAIFGEKTPADIRHYLHNTPQPWKFLSTAEGLMKIVKVCDEEGIEWRDTFFGLFDEFHSIIVDYKFRPILYKVLTTLFVQFRNSSLMSATPAQLSDPILSKYKSFRVIVDNRPAQPITLITTDCLLPTVVKFIREFINSSQKEDVICLFLNCVTKIEEIMFYLGAELREVVSVYCSGIDNNKITLDKYKGNMKTSTDQLTRINFLTQSYNHGWDLDLEQSNPTMVYVTDVTGAFTHQNLKINGVQSLGRARGEKKNLFHITNLKKEQKKNPTESEIRFKTMKQAEELEAGVNHLFMCKMINENDAGDVISSIIRPDNDYIEFQDCAFKINHAAVERLIQILVGNTYFTSVYNLEKAWKEKGFNPTHIKRKDKLEDILNGQKRIRRSVVDKRREVFSKLETYSKAPEGSSQWHDFQILKEEYNQYWSYLELLGYAEIERLRFNTTLINKKYDRRLEQNRMNGDEFRDELKRLLPVNIPYLRSELKKIAESLFKTARVYSAKATGESFKAWCEWRSVARLEGTPSSGNDNAFMILSYKPVCGWDEIKPTKSQRV